MAGDIIRYTEEDTIGTAIRLCDDIWSKDSNALFIASSHEDDLSDIICATPLAGQKKAPILLTDRDSLDKRVTKKISEVKPKEIYLLGNLSDALIEEIRDLQLGSKLKNLHQEDPWLTSRAINNELTDVKGTFVVNAHDIANAASITSYAAAQRYQIVLANEQGDVPKKEITGTLYLLGDKNLVKDYAGAKRLAGKDRYETNRIVVNTLDYKYGDVWIVNGEDTGLLGAFIASPVASVKNTAIVLANPAHDYKDDTLKKLDDLLENNMCHVIGEEEVISAHTVQSVLANLEYQWKAVENWSELKNAIESGRNVFLTHDISAQEGEELWIQRSVIIDGQNNKLNSRIWAIASGITLKNINIELPTNSDNNLLTNNAVVHSGSHLFIEDTVTIHGPSDSSFHGIFAENTLTILEDAHLTVAAGKSSLFEGDGIKARRLIIEDGAVVEGTGGDGDNYAGTGILADTLVLSGEPKVIGNGGKIYLEKDHNRYSADTYTAMNEKNYPDRVGNGIQCGEFRSDADSRPILIARGGTITTNGYKSDPRATGGCGFIITIASSPKAQVIGYFSEDNTMKTKHNLYYSVPYNVSGYAVYNHSKESLNVQVIDMTELPDDRVIGATWTKPLEVAESDNSNPAAAKTMRPEALPSDTTDGSTQEM